MDMQAVPQPPVPKGGAVALEGKFLVCPVRVGLGVVVHAVGLAGAADGADGVLLDHAVLVDHLDVIAHILVQILQLVEEVDGQRVDAGLPVLQAAELVEDLDQQGQMVVEVVGHHIPLGVGLGIGDELVGGEIFVG